MTKYQKAEESLGKRFGKLIVIEILGANKHGNKFAKCLCDCGEHKEVLLNRLRKGDTKSCGCARTQNANKQLKQACEQNPLLQKKLEPRLATAKKVYNARYSDGDLTFEDFLTLSQQNCFYCGTPPSNKTNHYVTKDNRYSEERRINGYFVYNGLDRIDNSLPHTLDNVVPSCIHCNKAKLDRSQEDFFKWISMVYAIHPYR